MPHVEREAWIMALPTVAIVVVGTLAGIVVQGLHRVFRQLDPRTPSAVIPAKAGLRDDVCFDPQEQMDSRFRANDAFWADESFRIRIG